MKRSLKMVNRTDGKPPLNLYDVPNDPFKRPHNKLRQSQLYCDERLDSSSEDEYELKRVPPITRDDVTEIQKNQKPPNPGKNMVNYE